MAVFAGGVACGVVLALATSFVFLLILLGPLFAFGAWLAGSRSSPRDDRPMLFGAGLLVGMGCTYLVGAVDTLASCWGSDVCGGSSATPLLVWSFVLAGVGSIAGLRSLARRPDQQR